MLKENMLKETYEMNLLEAIWNDITKAKNEFVYIRGEENIVVKN